MHQIRSSLLLLCLFWSLLVVAGCGEKIEYPEIVTTPSEPGPVILPTPSVTLPRTSTVGRSVQGRPVIATVLGSGPDTTLILGVVHGNEPAGAPLVRLLTSHLQANPDLLQGRKAVLVPNANPDGYAANSRYNSRGIDINRNFPAANRINDDKTGPAGFSEPESKIIADLISQHRPDRIVAIHQPLDCIDYDGPGGPLANHMGRHCNLPVKKLGARPGSLGSYAGISQGIPIITMELPPGGGNANALWQEYGMALVSAVTYPQNAK